MTMNSYTAKEEYPDLEDHHNHMAHCLTEEVYKRLRAMETTSGFNIDNVIQIGVDNPGKPYELTLGCLAGDEESYTVFAEFFDQVIEARHNGYKSVDKQSSNTNCSELAGGQDWDKNIAVCCRVRGVRNLQGFCLPSHCTRAERRKVENIVKNVLSKTTGDFKGSYYQMKGMSEEQQEKLLCNFKSDSPLSPSCLPTCLARDWPDARGIWVNESKNILVQVNGKDHLRIVTSEENANLPQAFSRFCCAMEQIEGFIKDAGYEFMKNSHLGYIATCPGNLGTGMSAGVRMLIPKTSKHTRFDEVLRRLRLEKRRVPKKENGVSNEGFFDIINADRLGLSEIELIQTVIDGVQFLINCEQKLKKSESIERDINLIKLK